MKKLICIVLALTAALLLCSCGEKETYPAATEQFYVDDFAGVIDSEDETALLNKAIALEKATTAQVVVVTVESLDGEEPADYALELGNKWGVGNEDADNGIVILLATDEREIYIAVGPGLEGALPDSKTGRIIDNYGLEDLKNDNFSDGLLKIGNAIINEVYIEYDMEPENGYIPADNLPENPGKVTNISKVALSWIIMFVVLILLSVVSRKRGGSLLWFIGPTGFGGGGRGSHGGFGGGGFGGFGGGGGSFGGGGAGRGF